MKIFRRKNRQLLRIVSRAPLSCRDDLKKLCGLLIYLDESIRGFDIGSIDELLKCWNRSKKSLRYSSAKSSSSPQEELARELGYITYRYKCPTKLVDNVLKSAWLVLDNNQLRPQYRLDKIYLGIESFAEFASLAAGFDTAQTKVVEEFLWLVFKLWTAEISRKSETDYRLFTADELVMFGISEVSRREAERKPAEFREFLEYNVIDRQNKLNEIVKMSSDMPKWWFGGIKKLHIS